MIRFLIPKAGIVQMPSINTPTIRRLLRVDAGLSLAHPRPLRIRRLLRDIKNKSIFVEWYGTQTAIAYVCVHTRRDLRRSINAITRVSA